MATLKNKKNDIRNEIRSKANKIDFNKLLNSEIIENEKVELLGYSTGQATQVYKYVINIIEKNNEELKNHIKSKIDELIPDSTVKIIVDFVNIKAINEKIETEMKDLKRKINSLGNSVDEVVEKVKLEIELNEKQEQLIKNKEEFIRLYKEGLNNSTISDELYEAFLEVGNITNKVREECEKEIELMQAKIQVLRRFYQESNIANDMKLMIEERINSVIRAETLIETSKEKVPAIQVLVK